MKRTTTRMTPEMRRDWTAWLAGRPDAVRAVAEKFDPTMCYRNPAHKRGHYRLYSVEEPKDAGAPITISMAHLDDSFLPSFRVFGLDPNDFELCGCLADERPAEDRR